MRKLMKVFAVLCAAALAPQLAQAQHTSKLKIGFSFEAMNGERWQTDLISFQTRAKQLGAEVISTDAKGDDDLQLQQVQQMIHAGIKVLVFVPHDPVKAANIVEAAKSAGVKVISYDRLVANSNVDLYITFDRVAIAKMQAEYLVKLAPRGNYVVLTGSPNDQGAKTLHDEQLHVLGPYVARGEIKVIADESSADWLPTEAYLHMLAAIESAHGEIAAVVASNDGLAGGAIQALREHNLAGKVFVSGQDADLVSIISIIEGAQSMTVYKPIPIEARRAAEEAVRLAKRETPRTDGVTNNGKSLVPTVTLKPVLVTKDNIKSTIIKDHFQTLHDINQGLPKELQLN